MKTILVVYTNETKLSKVEMGRLKRYSFNTKAEVNVGDIIETDEYDTNLMVAEVMNESYSFYNRATGDLSNVKSANTNWWTIRELIIGDKNTDVVYGRLKEN